MLSQEAGRADRNRHYGLYIDGDIAKLPGGRFGINIHEPKDVIFFYPMHNICFAMNHIFFMLGGRKGAAVLCELLKKGESGGPQGPGYPGSNPRSRPGRPGYQDRGYPDYHGNRNRPYN